MNEKKGKSRLSNFELLRIISMILIVINHYVVSSGVLDLEFNINRVILQLFGIGGKIGVTLFVLISGYFLIDSKFKMRKLLKIILETLFYSVSIYFLLWAFQKQKFSIKGMIKVFLPITMGE